MTTRRERAHPVAALKARIEASVYRPNGIDGCWLWTGRRRYNGYVGISCAGGGEFSCCKNCIASIHARDALAKLEAK